jgi:hypothetical protein
VDYTVTSSDSTIVNVYTVTVTVTPARTENVMSNVFFPGIGYAWTSDDTGTNFLIYVPSATALTALAPTYSVSPGALGSPVSATARNFTTPQTYIVTAEDGAQQGYSVTVQKVTTVASGYQGLVLASGPVSYWPLNETNGTTAFDIASGLNPMTYGGTLTLNQTGLRADGNPSVLFFAAAADPDNTRAAYNASLNPNQFTVECWVKPTNITVQYLVSIQDRTGGGRTGYAIWKNNGGPGFGMQWGTGPTTTGSINSPNAAIPDIAYHVVATYDGATMRLYENGILVNSQSVAVYQPASAAQPGFTVGSRNGISSAPSCIQDVALYTRALTQDEITTHYQNAPIFTMTKSGADVVLSWIPSGGGTLQTNSVVTGGGGYQDVTGATSPTTNTPSAGNKFYRVKF